MSRISSFQCGVCGGLDYSFRSVLWSELINDWQISEYEAKYINRQQGEICNSCGSNLRSIALANAIRRALEKSDFLVNLSDYPELASTRILEINEAGNLTRYTKKLGEYYYGSYPAVDLHNLPYDSNFFDLVIHSDTLEHVRNPVHALTECRRVLRQGGSLCFTVPVIVGRMTRSREGLKKSFHGAPGMDQDDFVVHTEFGADTWTYLFEAGFSEITIHSVDYPAAMAFLARK